MCVPRQFGLFIIAAACGLAGLALPARACTTPVYQYALEQWPEDAYVVTVYRRGELSQAERAALDRLTKAASEEEPEANLCVKTVDVAEADALPIASVTLPWIVVNYPERHEGLAPVLSCPLSLGKVEALLDSPGRREIAKRLLTGHAGVWVFVESGEKAKDERALKVLEAELEKHSKALKERAAQALGQEGADSCEGLSFSILRVSGSDPAEQALVSMLLNSEADLQGISGEPMAFPIFGRGRILYAVVGRGINEDVIAEACEFLMGPCACIIKEENPGTDLLIAFDWDKALEGGRTAEDLLPLLAGVFPDEAAQAPAVAARAPVAAGRALHRIDTSPAVETAPAASSNMARNALIALVAVAVAGAVFALVVRSRHRSQEV